MHFKTLVLTLVGIIPVICGQTCKPHPEDITLPELSVWSPIVVSVSLKNQPKLTKAQRKLPRNVTGDIVNVFATHNDGLKKGKKITFGPIGKTGGCEEMKSGRYTYLVFLNKSNDDEFYWINYNPLQASKRTIRKVQKLLCKGCLVPPKFKKKSKVLKRKEGEKVKLKCKASGKPKPDMSWYYNGVLLTKSNMPKKFKVKTSKRGGSTSLQIKGLTIDNNGKDFICNAKNVASDVSANFTISIKVKEVPHVAKCDKPCDEKHANYCSHGSCCLDESSHPYCICNAYYTGKRCFHQTPKNSPVHEPSESFRHQQRLIALLGVCLAIMVILFICFAVYCLFSKQRNKLHRKILLDGYTGSKNSETSPMITYPDDADGISVTALNEPSNQSQQGSSRDELSRRYPLPLHMNGNGFNSENAESSMTTAVLNDSRHSDFSTRFQISSVSSINGSGSKRSRLNGLAKSSSRHSSVKQNDHSERNVSQSSTPILTKMSCSINNNNNCGSKSSLNDHKFSAIPSSSSATNLPIQQASVYDATVNSVEEDGFNPGVTKHNETMFTSNCDGDIQEKTNHCDKSSHSPSLSSKNLHLLHRQGHSSSMPTSVNSPPVSCDRRRFFSDQQNHEKQTNINSNYPLSSDNISHPSLEDISSDVKPGYFVSKSAKSSTGDHDDLFEDIEIPDTSLELYNSSTQSLKRAHLSQPQVDSEGFYYPQSSTHFRFGSASVASAQLHHLPLLSKQSQSDETLSNISVSDHLCDETCSFKNTESPKIIV